MSNTAVITIGSHSLAHISDRVEQVVKPHLTYTQTEFGASNGRVSFARNKKCVYVKENGGGLTLPVGCVQRVSEALRQAGHAVSIRDLRDLGKKNLQVDMTDFDVAENCVDGITNCLKQFSEGILGIPRGRPRGRTVGAMCRLLPKAKFLIACSTWKGTKQMAAELLNFVGGEVKAVRGGNWHSPCRVVCGTYKSFDTSRAADWDVLVFDDALESLAKLTHENRASYGRHRVYSFIAPECGLTAKQLLELEVLAGPIIYHDRRNRGRHEFELEVVFCAAPGERLRPARLPKEKADQLATASRRNDLIATVAAAFAANDSDKLWKSGLFLNDAHPFRRWANTPRVAVLVGSARHADILAKLLPDWMTMTRRPASPSGSSSVKDAWSAWFVPSRSIITAVRAADYKHFDADVIVMACGGAHPQLPAGLQRRGGHVLVVDFADESKPPLMRDTASRRAAYDRLSASGAAE